MTTKDSLGDMMKEFELSEAGRKIMKGLPFIARLDGRAFHMFTKGLKRPYDERMSLCMIETAKFLVKETHASIGYTQSDEISIGWEPKRSNNGEFSEILFGGRFQKLTSILAALASVKFFQLIQEHLPEKADKLPVFDCRVWQMPTLELAAKAFLWRELDATKNSISMAAHAYFPHKMLQGLGGSDKQQMLFERGINWNDYPNFFKRGSYIQRRNYSCTLTNEERAKIPEKHRPEEGKLFTRSKIVELDLPKAQSIQNYASVLFFGVDPVLKQESLFTKE